MALTNMVQFLLGVPGVNFGLAKTMLNEAFEYLQNENNWSFMLKTGGFLTPGLLGGLQATTFLTPGTIKVNAFSTQVVGDAVATALWLQPTPAQTGVPITQQQIRIPLYALYDIISIGSAPTVAYLTVLTAGSGQTPGTYTVNATGGGGTGAQASIVVNSDGTVTQQPTVLDQGSGYTSAPTFTLAAGGTPATFSSTLNAVLNIDRPWTEPPQIQGGNYMIYQCYYVLPVGFRRFFTFSDPTNNNSMDFWTKTQQDLFNDDPQRTIFDQPYYVVPFGIDTRTGSATYGQQRVELWPHPSSQLPYWWEALVNWPKLQNLTDTLPFPITEEIVKFRALEQLALWKESQKGDEQQRGSGANWQFLAGANKDEYERERKRLRLVDRSLVELYFTRAGRVPPFYGEPFSTVNGQINVGRF